MLPITLRQLKIFAEVVEQGSFRRCAETLEITQVAVSDHVRELENRLGVPLFDRRPGVSALLTPQGERVHRHVQQILRGVALLLDECAGPLDGEGRERLTLGMHAFIVRRLQGALAELERAKPALSVRLDYSVFTAARLDEALRGGQLSAGYFYALDVPHTFESSHAWNEPLAIYVGASHPLARRERVSVRELALEGYVGLPSGHPLRQMIDEVLHRAGVAPPRVALETSEFGLVVSSLREGLGFGCLFERAGEGFLRPDALVRVAMDQPLPSLQVRCAVAPVMRRDPRLVRLMRRLAEHHDMQDRQATA
jgi:DNA-binding transcriptional LysR family regulator